MTNLGFVFFNVVGAILLPTLTVLIVELARLRDLRYATRAGGGYLVGWLLSTGVVMTDNLATIAGSEIDRAIGSLSRSKFQAPSGPQSAFWPLDCGPARANLDLLSLPMTAVDTALRHTLEL